MHNYNRLTHSIKLISKGVYDSIKPVNIMFGEVVNEEPLKIQIEQKFTLDKDELILTRNVTKFQTKISKIDNESKAESYYMFNNLKKGEDVILLSLEGGQKFLVLDRVGDFE